MRRLVYWTQTTSEKSQTGRMSRVKKGVEDSCCLYYNSVQKSDKNESDKDVLKWQA